MTVSTMGIASQEYLPGLLNLYKNLVQNRGNDSMNGAKIGRMICPSGLMWRQRSPRPRNSSVLNYRALKSSNKTLPSLNILTNFMDWLQVLKDRYQKWIDRMVVMSGSLVNVRKQQALQLAFSFLTPLQITDFLDILSRGTFCIHIHFRFTFAFSFSTLRYLKCAFEICT
jgi:hypothetical protein